MLEMRYAVRLEVLITLNTEITVFLDWAPHDPLKLDTEEYYSNGTHSWYF
jgi:hypothetical protein